MEEQQDLHSCLVVWRGQKFVVEMNPSATLKELGDKLQQLTNVEADTLRILVPMEKSSKLLYPFSDEHSCLSLGSASVLKGKSIRMMGVPKDEVDEVLKNAKADLRIAGFDEEERRMKQRNVNGSHSSVKLPQGTYIFCDFQTLSLPGVELDPPASKALELLHKLASDPGIIAIMNKHRWRVGILTEMAPVGYVGISPKCILGFNKNHGEEISLRLRTDDLKGFRKYESIKKTLLHELAHMVFSEHDSHFYALDRQLNQEAASLDWTKSRGHTLGGVTHLQHYDDEEFDPSINVTSSRKIGGQASVLPNARAASVSAAFERLANTSTTFSRSSEEVTALPDHEVNGDQNVSEPDPDDSEGDESMLLEPYVESGKNHLDVEMDPLHIEGPLPAQEPDRCEQSNHKNWGVSPIEPSFDGDFQRRVTILEQELDHSEADQNQLRFQNTVQPEMDFISLPSVELPSRRRVTILEPELDDSEVDQNQPRFQNTVQPEMDFTSLPSVELPSHVNSTLGETHSNGSCAEEMQTELGSGESIPRRQNDEPDPDDLELQVIQDPVTMFCSRLQSAIRSLKYEVEPLEIGRVLQTLIKIVGNVIEHPNDMKFKKLRKANPMIQRNIIANKAAVDVLTLIGFCEDVVIDESGKAEVFLVLKRNDPGLLWLAKSSLETCRL